MSSSSAARQAIRDRVASVTLPAGLPATWTALRDSKEVYPHWRRSSRSPVHLEFCVGATSAAPIDPTRQRPGPGCLVGEEIVVGLSVQLRPGADREVDGDALLLLERAIRDHLLSRWSSVYAITWRSSERSPGPDEAWLYSEIRAVCLYVDTLQT